MRRVISQRGGKVKGFDCSRKSIKIDIINLFYRTMTDDFAKTDQLPAGRSKNPAL